MAMAELTLSRADGIKRLATLKSNGLLQTAESDRGIPYLKSSLDSRPIKIYDPNKIINNGENVIFIKPQK